MNLSNLSNELLAALVQYGLPALFSVILLASTGIPLPVTFVLIAAGSFIAQGNFTYWPVVGLAIAGAVAGDQLGYLVGRWGGKRLRGLLTRFAGGEARFVAADQAARRWGGPGIFLSRWLFTPLGPAVNITSGFAEYSWPKFLAYDVAGEVIWVNGYVEIGRLFSDRVAALTSLLGDLAWVSIALVLLVALGWLFVRSLRTNRAAARSGVPVQAVDLPGGTTGDD